MTQSPAAPTVIPPSPSDQRISKISAALWTFATIITPLLIYLIFSSVYIGYWFAVTRHQGQPPQWLILRSMWLCLPPAYWLTIAIWWLAHRRRAPFSDLFALRSRDPLVDIAIGLALAAGWIIFYSAGGVVSFQQMFTFDAAKLFSAPTSISAGFCEEFLFRGFLFFLLARAGGGPVSKVLISALAFGLAHVLWGPVAMFWTAILGASFAAVLLWRGNIWPVIIAHILLDLCIEPALIQNAIYQART